MATEKKPKKGILKSTSSFDKPDEVERERKICIYIVSKNSKEMKWDEMNILATHHPPGKDYGHMKIDEPPTPYSKYSDQEDEDGGENRRDSVGATDIDVNPDSLAARLHNVDQTKAIRTSSFSEDNESSDDEAETEEERAKRKMFEQKRKLHYNEFQAVKLAKQLMEEEEEDDEGDENEEKKGSNQNACQSSQIKPNAENLADDNLQSK